MTKKKTHEEFVEQVQNLVGSDYTVLTTYQNAKTKVLMQHNSCLHKWLVLPSSFTSKGTRCPKCNTGGGFKKKKTHADFAKEVKEKVGKEYLILSKYVDSKTKVLLKHNICGYEWSVLPGSITNSGQRCPKCSGKLKKTTKMYKEEVFNLVGSAYRVLGDYQNCMKKILMKHEICGYEWEITPNSFLSGTRCPKCQHRSYRKTTKEFKEEVYTLVKNEYEILGSYEGKDRKIKIMHSECGNVFKMTPHAFLQGQRCPQCQHRGYRKTTEEFKKEVLNLVGKEYVVIGKYVTNQTKIKMQHSNCGLIYKVTPNAFLSHGNRCPNCVDNKRSKGAIQVEEFLKKNNLQYKREYKLKDCKNIESLPFDFAVFDGNKLLALIEYDGRQHFEPVKLFGGKENLKYTQRNDSIKNKYCVDNKIFLIRIPYYKRKKIEKILSEKLLSLFPKLKTNYANTYIDVS